MPFKCHTGSVGAQVLEIQKTEKWHKMCILALLEILRGWENRNTYRLVYQPLKNINPSLNIPFFSPSVGCISSCLMLKTRNTLIGTLVYDLFQSVQWHVPG